MQEHKKYNVWNALVERILEQMGLRIRPISPNIRRWMKNIEENSTKFVGSMKGFWKVQIAH